MCWSIAFHADCWGLPKPFSQESVFSISAKEESLDSLLSKISRATDYQIEIGQEWTGYPITIGLKDVTVHDALRRVFSKFNNAIVINETDKKIFITIFDKPKNENTSRQGRAIYGKEIFSIQQKKADEIAPTTEADVDESQLFQKPTRKLFQDSSGSALGDQPSQPDNLADSIPPPEDLFKRD
jgi:hypothetical protein